MEERFFECHICNSDEVSNDNTLGLKSVSSDCKVIDLPFVLGFCRNANLLLRGLTKIGNRKFKKFMSFIKYMRQVTVKKKLFLIMSLGA